MSRNGGKKGKLEVEQTIAGLPKTALCEYCKKNNKDPFDVFKERNVY